MNTRDFKTKSEIIERKMPRINGNNQYHSKIVISLDIGYSAVKGIGPSRVFRYPSYAKKAGKNFEVIGKVRAEDIQYRDNKTGEVWLVGQSAETLMNERDIASTTDESQYTRYRYNSEMFKVLAGTGLALGLANENADNEIFLQTGLPSEYKERDTNSLVSALAGDYDMSIKVGNNDWCSFKFSLDAKHIGIMEQPQGTLCSVTYNNGELSELGKTIMKSSSMIFDGGFNTEDIFVLKAGYKENHNTFTDTGMRAVFDEVLRLISKDYPIDTKIFEFQKYLDEGKLSYFNQEDFSVHEVEFNDLLEKVNASLCDKSLKRLLEQYNNMLDFNYLVVTGGTGESRLEQIKDFFKSWKNLTVIPGNLNTPDLPYCYANAVGYYMFRYAKLASEMKKAMQV